MFLALRLALFIATKCTISTERPVAPYLYFSCGTQSLHPREVARLADVVYRQIMDEVGGIALNNVSAWILPCEVLLRMEYHRARLDVFNIILIKAYDVICNETREHNS